MSSRKTNQGDGAAGIGCLFLVIAIIVAVIVAAFISLAALVDPFNWMPSVAQIWADCEGDCALAHRFPGFWWHAVASLAYAAGCLAVVVAFGMAVLGLRAKRPGRLANATAAAEHAEAHAACLAFGAILAALALFPLLVAIA